VGLTKEFRQIMALILVADDEFLLTEMLAAMLEDAGYQVLTASHGEQALRLMRERTPRLLITDFMMPVMNGLELARAIRNDECIAHIPIVLVSGAQGAAARRHPELFQRVLDKPYDIQHLLRIVNELAPLE